jgi:Na+-driven multidrug efflux pump
MNHLVGLRQLMTFSFFINLFTWLATIFIVQHFSISQFDEYKKYSIMVFIAAIFFKSLKHIFYEMPPGVEDTEWPRSLFVFHSVPLFVLVAYSIYYFAGGSIKINWSMVFLAPFMAGIGFINYFFVYNKK